MRKLGTLEIGDRRDQGDEPGDHEKSPWRNWL